MKLTRPSLLSLLLGALTASAAPGESGVKWICSTEQQRWRAMPSPSLMDANPEQPAESRIAPRRTYQTIEGFGGCFNELGWVALTKASTKDREEVLRGLFGDDGCAFTLGRLPIGASDFATDAYSLDDTAGDLDLKHFSIERDKKHLLPFVKAALKVRPNLQCWLALEPSRLDEG